MEASSACREGDAHTGRLPPALPRCHPSPWRRQWRWTQPDGSCEPKSDQGVRAPAAPAQWARLAQGNPHCLTEEPTLRAHSGRRPPESGTHNSHATRRVGMRRWDARGLNRFRGTSTTNTPLPNAPRTPPRCVLTGHPSPDARRTHTLCVRSLLPFSTNYPLNLIFQHPVLCLVLLPNSRAIRLSTQTSLVAKDG